MRWPTTRDDVVGAARRERHDQLDRLRRKFIGGKSGRCQQRDDHKQPAERFHAEVPSDVPPHGEEREARLEP
jgi:hypothetical protein